MAEPVFNPGRILVLLEQRGVDYLFELGDRRGADVGFDSLRQRSVDQDIGGVVVHVAGLDDIIAAKEHADRDKDRQALPERHSHTDGIDGHVVSARPGLGDSLVAVHLVPALGIAVHAGSAIRQISWRVTNPILS